MSTGQRSFLLTQSIFLCLLLSIGHRVHGQEESVVLDPVTGDYVITYEGLDLEGNRKWQRVVYVPATKIVPEVESTFRSNEEKTIAYTYKVRNHIQSKQALDGFDIIGASHADPVSAITPRGWRPIITPDFNKSGQESGFIVGWSFETSGGLAPGKSQYGFGFQSLHLPGVGSARLTGYVDALNGFPDEGPGNDNPIYPQYQKLIFNDFVQRHTAVPRISVPIPFDAAAVLAGIQKHLNQDLVSMKLVDAAFAMQLDRLLQTAVQAAKQGNTQGLRSNIQDLRRLLKREHEHIDKEEEDRDDDWKKKYETKSKSKLIDKLAARVLDFDLRYVLRRLEWKNCAANCVTGGARPYWRRSAHGDIGRLRLGIVHSGLA